MLIQLRPEIRRETWPAGDVRLHGRGANSWHESAGLAGVGPDNDLGLASRTRDRTLLHLAGRSPVRTVQAQREVWRNGHAATLAGVPLRLRLQLGLGLRLRLCIR